MAGADARICEQHPRRPSKGLFARRIPQKLPRDGQDAGGKTPEHLVPGGAAASGADPSRNDSAGRQLFRGGTFHQRPLQVHLHHRYGRLLHERHHKSLQAGPEDVEDAPKEAEDFVLMSLRLLVSFAVD